MKHLLLIVLLTGFSYVYGQVTTDDKVSFRLAKEGDSAEDMPVLKIENLGLKVNSELPELRPTISPDGQLLFFIRQNHRFNTKYNVVENSQDIWFSMIDSTGQWTDAVHLGDPLNTVEYNAVLWISSDNNRILIRNAFVNGVYMGDGVSMCYLTKYGSWSKPEMLHIKNFEKYNRSGSYGATLASDGQTLLLYMAADKNNRNHDLFVSFLRHDGSWSEPQNLGNEVNLKDYNEMSPYLAPDGRTLYFSSDRPGGLGNTDIWRTRRMGRGWKKWSDPINLGGSVNTPGWETFFTLDAAGEYAYLATDQSTYGSTDIARVKLSDVLRPEPVILLTGRVLNAKTNEAMGAKLIYEDLAEVEVDGNGVSDPIDGSYKLVLAYEKNYSIFPWLDKYFPVSNHLNLDSVPDAFIKEIKQDLFLYPLPMDEGQIIPLNNVTYNQDKSRLTAGSSLELDRVAKLLAEYPSMTIEINAKPDTIVRRTKGKNSVNPRENIVARAVAEYLIAKGIAPDRVKAIEEPEPTEEETTGDTVAEENKLPAPTDERFKWNHEVEFKVLKK